MKGLRIFGEYLTEFFVITLLVVLSVVTVVGFIPMIVGVTGFFSNPIGTRRFRDIFITIGQNWKILISYSIFQLVIVVFPILNIYFFLSHPENINGFMLAVSYITLFIGAVYLTTAPTVIVNMNVTFMQLLFNGIMMLFGSPLRSLIALAAIAGVIALILYYPYVVILALYAALYISAVMMKENFLHLKAKALGVSVYELKAKQNEDDYFDENGRINRSSDNGD